MMQDVETTRSEHVKMTIQTGLLDSLGINMYTSIGKSLVEFVANGFDAEANNVNIVLPFEKIQAARDKLRKSFRGKTSTKKTQRVYEPLPDSIEIVVFDDGHGMTVDEIENKFLVINRNRRMTEGDKTESGKRQVMGRKGLGKLAGFGVAEIVEVESKRAGDTHSTSICMDYRAIEKENNIASVSFETTYRDGLDEGEHWTAVRLRRLRCDSMRDGQSTIEKVIAQNFHIMGDDFTTLLNDVEIKSPEVEYEFVYPPNEEMDEEGFAEADVKVDEDFNYPIRYAVKFRSRAQSGSGARGHLAAKDRGARVYCNQRLAAGPTLFDIDTGMHNFHATSYIECIVHADVLDQQEADLIGTSRSNLKTDNEEVDALIETVTQLMRDGIAAHGKFREQLAEQEIQNDPVSRSVLQMVSGMPRRNQKAAKMLLHTLAVSTDGVGSDTYQEVAPYLVNAINSSEVIVDLIKSGINPTTFSSILKQLVELAKVEKGDVLKLYRARKHGINALQILEERSHSSPKEPNYEKDLQQLLKDNPWLIRPEFERFLTSDAQIGEVGRKLSKALQVDEFAKDPEHALRPDLVFMLLNPGNLSSVHIVELKSPNIDLDNDHLQQLEGYIMQVESILSNDLKRQISVTGCLIGNVPKPDTSKQKARLLKSKIEKAGPTSQWEVVTLPELLERARFANSMVVEALEKEENDTESKESSN